jgi:formamidopyrimidine-DNA glycosylase
MGSVVGEAEETRLMPELPEVEVIMRGVAPHLEGESIGAVSSSGQRLRLPVPSLKLKKLISGHQVRAVGRRAKYGTVLMENGALLLIHLGMTGRLGFFPAQSPKAKHDHLCFALGNGTEMRFNDVRRFGSVQVFGPNEPEKEKFFAALGPEPFSDEFSGGYLKKLAKGRKRPVKNFLMDGRVVAGIGNIYASEILFAAGISPLKEISAIPLPLWEKIIAASRKILQQAIEAGGSSVSDFVNSSGEKGYFQLSLNVYGRSGKECRQCGKKIMKEVQAGRATFYCPGCQK